MMTNSRWLKLMHPFSRTVSSGKRCDGDSLCRKPSVNEEYQEAFRTKSYIDICNKAQIQQGKSSTRRRSSSSSSLPFTMHLTECLLEPRQEAIADMVENLNLHHLLVDYFEASLEASRYCDTILEGIHQMRLASGKIKRIVKLSIMVPDWTDPDHTHANDKTQKAVYKELASFALLANPLSIDSPVQFGDIHERYMVLLHRLKSKGKKIRRRVQFKRVSKMVGGISLVLSQLALLVALLAFAFHSVVGIVVAPSVIGCSMGLFRKRIKWTRRTANSRAAERLSEQLDIAARGVYILINDFDTMSRMVKRLHNEVEHLKSIADLGVKNGKCEILRQVVSEFNSQESSFSDQLEELEEHIYLCFLTINRSRRLVIEEIIEKQD